MDTRCSNMEDPGPSAGPSRYPALSLLCSVQVTAAAAHGLSWPFLRPHGLCGQRAPCGHGDVLGADGGALVPGGVVGARSSFLWPWTSWGHTVPSTVPIVAMELTWPDLSSSYPIWGHGAHVARWFFPVMSRMWPWSLFVARMVLDIVWCRLTSPHAA